MKITSRKNGRPSIANGTPNTPPNCPIKPGHRIPSSNESTVPAEDVEGNEDGLEEEREAFDRERHSEHAAELSHQAGPQDPELEREHRARHRSNGKRHAHHVGPATSETERILVAVPETAGVRD